MLGAQLPLASALPFVALLAAIALLPLVAPRWWHPNHNKTILAVAVSLPVLWHLGIARSEEHTSELQSRRDLVCRLLLEKKKKKNKYKTKITSRKSLCMLTNSM